MFGDSNWVGREEKVEQKKKRGKKWQESRVWGGGTKLQKEKKSVGWLVGLKKRKNKTKGSRGHVPGWQGGGPGARLGG